MTSSKPLHVSVRQRVCVEGGSTHSECFVALCELGNVQSNLTVCPEHTVLCKQARTHKSLDTNLVIIKRILEIPATIISCGIAPSSTSILVSDFLHLPD